MPNTKKHFTEMESLFIRIMTERKKPLYIISKELKCDFYRVKVELLKQKANAQVP
jgi:hypothetical protein